jgi:hypothetical protein
VIVKAVVCEYNHTHLVQLSTIKITFPGMMGSSISCRSILNSALA